MGSQTSKLASSTVKRRLPRHAESSLKLKPSTVAIPKRPHDQEESHKHRFEKDPNYATQALKLGQIKVEEIPLKLDQSLWGNNKRFVVTPQSSITLKNPALTLLRNRTAHLAQIQQDKDANIQVRGYLSPETFCAVVNDLSYYKEEEVLKRYSLSVNADVLKDVVRNVKAIEMSTAKDRIGVTNDAFRDDKEQDLKDLRRINGINGGGAGSQLEKNLESLLDPK